VYATSIKHIKWLAAFLLILISEQFIAQELKDYSTGNLKYLAAESEMQGDYLTAADFYEELSRRKPKNSDFQYRLARNLHKSSQFTKSREIYSKLASENQKDYPLASFYEARILIMEGKCEKAVEILQKFRKSYRGEKDERKYRRMAKFSIEACTESEFTEEKKLIVKPAAKEINGANMEASPIFENENRMIYSSLLADPNKQYDSEEALPTPQFFVASKKNGEWKKEGSFDQLQLPDGYYAVSGAFNQQKNRIYISACKDIYSQEKQCDLFRMSLQNGKWSAPEKLDGLVNSRSQERHPAVGIDEKGRETLYFVSNREEGKGGFDIWYSTYYEKKDSYKEAKNCGSKVNSVGDEITPFIDAETGVLYFSSEAHPGIGGFDVFRSSGSRSKWMEPENLGSQINGPMDELFYTLDPTGQSGFFVSNRTYASKKQPCCDDLFYFTDPDLIALTYNGQLADENGNALGNASLMIYEVDDSTGEEFVRKRMTTDKDGNFNFRLEPDRLYNIKAEKEGYFTNSKEISTLGKMSSRNVKLDLRLEKLSDKVFVLENIYYDFNESALSEKAKNTIDTSIFEILVENPTIVVEIGSHTDSKGRSAYNASLSQRRAESVVKYLIQRGIRKDRLSAKGYGETQPVAPNKNEDGSDNPEGRAKNRRTEFKVVGQIKLKEDEDD